MTSALTKQIHHVRCLYNGAGIARNKINFINEHLMTIHLTRNAIEDPMGYNYIVLPYWT